MRAVNAMLIDFKPAGEPSTRTESSYHMMPATISITGKGQLSVGEDLEAVLAKSNTGIKRSDHDKNLFIEQHKDGYAILRGGVKEPLAVEPTQDAAIEKARKLEPDAAIHVERVRNVEGGGRDKWRRI
jgi:hypothetical protein